MAISSLKVKSVKPQHHVRKLSTKRKLDGHRFVDMDIFSNIINCLACPKCFDSNMVVEENYEKKKGLASFIHISCNNCEFSKESYTSKTLKKEEVRKGMNPHDINYRAVNAARTVGQGYAGLEKFCGMLNLPEPMTNNNFDLISNIFSVAAKEVAEKRMLDAANELRHGVSVDGTWQRRGFVSLNGTVAAISMIMAKLLMLRSCKGIANRASNKRKN